MHGFNFKLTDIFMSVTELVQSKHRTKVSVFYQNMYGAGYIVETVVAYKNRNWQALMVFFLLSCIY